jgi:hypothetical protein
MSPRSPHVNVRVRRRTHDQLDQIAIQLSAVIGRRLSLTDVLAAAVITADRDKMQAVLQNQALES